MSDQPESQSANQADLKTEQASPAGSSNLVMGCCWGLILTLVLVGFIWVFSSCTARLGQWVELDKQLFGFGHAPGDLLSDSTIKLSQQCQRFSGIHLLVLSGIFLWLLICAPVFILLRDRRNVIAYLWGSMGVLVLCGFGAYPSIVASSQGA